jgi:Domain of unknown function (DUF4148)
MSVHRNLLAVAVLSASTLTALAQGHGDAVSRGQVRAEAAAAVAAGQIPRGELAPISAASTRAGGAWRAQIRSETVAAVAAGGIGRGEIGSAAPPFESIKQRAEVRAETRMALQLGLVPRGEAPAREASTSELEQIRLAGQRARGSARQLASR